jgi:hypothetical protein
MSVKFAANIQRRSKIAAAMLCLFCVEVFMARKAMSKIVDPQPLVSGGVKYQSHANSVEAVDVQSGKLLWHTVCYPDAVPEHPDPGMEEDAQWNIISALKVVGDEIEARDGHGRTFQLDRKTGKLLKAPAEIILKVGDKKPLENLEIKLVKIVSDSRCPKGENCYWIGMVVAEIEVSLGSRTGSLLIGNMGHSVVVKKPYDPNVIEYPSGPTSFGGRDISLAEVEPDRSTAVPMRAVDYRLHFQLKAQ